MRLLLHLGQVKTGSTALQQGLHGASRDLRARGVLYPRFGGRAIAHHALLPLCEDPNRLPAWSLQDQGGAETAALHAWEVWNRTCEAVLADPPKVMVLSSELLIQHTRPRAKQRLADILAELTPDLMPVIYVRHPVAHFRARLQEWLKVESAPLPVVEPTLRAAILDCESSFGTPPHLVAYDRAGLLGGGIVRDFATRFLADHLCPDDLPQAEVNAGLSAEALVLLARLRAEAGHVPDSARRVARLIAPLAALDRSDPPDRPLTLLPDVAQAVLRAATCHHWLAETGRLHLPGLDTRQIDGSALPDWLLTAPPESLFLHDPARLLRLRESLTRVDPT
ncbi:hypothetical protein [Tabrizicola aquatica]|uniref:hypothetical protein n=1 Tax=Tabrizicola aquatica TaxID=909926 RepID=UPI000CD1A248|nr:hypothetical protein [Tabrizicola aquatica]